MRKFLLLFVLAFAACTPVKQAPLIVPSAIPPMPIPPNGAAVGMYIPPADISGERPTPNRGLSEDESIWHFRSAFNVAALNCQSAAHLRLAGDYNRYIAVHRSRLNLANAAVDLDFKKRYPAANGLRVRDTHMTDIYNYFALPPVTAGFCNLMLKLGPESSMISSSALGQYSIASLREIDQQFIDFYDAYDRYQRQLADWKSMYGSRGKVTVEHGGSK